MDNKFLCRGKRLDNGEWVTGYYCFIGYTGRQKHYIIPEYASDFYGIEIDPKTVILENPKLLKESAENGKISEADNSKKKTMVEADRERWDTT